MVVWLMLNPHSRLDPLVDDFCDDKLVVPVNDGAWIVIVTNDRYRPIHESGHISHFSSERMFFYSIAMFSR